MVIYANHLFRSSYVVMSNVSYNILEYRYYQENMLIYSEECMHWKEEIYEYSCIACLYGSS